jgi:hypothetical protein
MAFQVNQSSNVNEETADVIVEGVKIVHIVKEAGKPAVISIFADGAEPTHVIDMGLPIKAKKAKVMEGPVV